MLIRTRCQSSSSYINAEIDVETILGLLLNYGTNGYCWMPLACQETPIVDHGYCNYTLLPDVSILSSQSGSMSMDSVS